jgi:hypothetical protein
MKMMMEVTEEEQVALVAGVLAVQDLVHLWFSL